MHANRFSMVMHRRMIGDVSTRYQSKITNCGKQVRKRNLVTDRRESTTKCHTLRRLSFSRNKTLKVVQLREEVQNSGTQTGVDAYRFRRPASRSISEEIDLCLESDRVLRFTLIDDGNHD